MLLPFMVLEGFGGGLFLWLVDLWGLCVCVHVVVLLFFFFFDCGLILF